MYANPIHASRLLYGTKVARNDFKDVPRNTFYRKARSARAILLEERSEKVLNAFDIYLKSNYSEKRGLSLLKSNSDKLINISFISKLAKEGHKFCKKVLLEKGLIKTAESTYRKIYDFYVVDLPNRTKTQEIRQAEMDYIKDGNDLLALIRKCEKEKKENSIFKKAYKQYTFQNEVLAKKKSINRLAKLCGFGSTRTKKIAERLGFVL